MIYVAPEQLAASGQEPTRAADVYGLGMSALFCLLGADPRPEVMRDALAVLSRCNAPSRVRAAVAPALAWRPEHRYRSAAEFRDAIEASLAPMPESRRWGPFVLPVCTERSSEMTATHAAPGGDLRLLLIGADPPPAANHSVAVLRSYVSTRPDLAGQLTVDTLCVDLDYEAVGRLLCGIDRAVLTPLFERLVASQLDVIGFSVYIWNRPLMTAMAKAARELCPAAFLVAGGPEVGFRPEAALDAMPWLDAVASGEGEETLADVLRARLDPQARAMAAVSGLCIRDRDGTPRSAPPRAALLDPSRVPSVILGQGALADRRVVLLESYRGCPHRCSYCLYHRQNRAIRRSDPERIVAEIREALHRGVEVVGFADSIFGLNEEDAVRFLDAAIASYNGFTRFEFELHADALREPVLARLGQLQQLGAVAKVEVGLQTTSPVAGPCVEGASIRRGSRPASGASDSTSPAVCRWT